MELTALLGCTIDQILFPAPVPAPGANFEQTLLPYAPIADFSGRRWPRSMSKPAILSAIKLFMGLEERRGTMNRQINDDTEYILQAAFSGVSFGYSWGPDDDWESCLGAYGLTCQVHASADFTQESFIRMAADKYKERISRSRHSQGIHGYHSGHRFFRSGQDPAGNPFSGR